MLAQPEADYEDTGGIGGTLAGNALSLAAMRATLSSALRRRDFAMTIPLAARFASGVRRVASDTGLAWSVAELGARAEYRFEPRPARNGTEAHAQSDHRARALPASARPQSRPAADTLPQHGPVGAQDDPRPTSIVTPSCSRWRLTNSAAEARPCGASPEARRGILGIDAPGSRSRRPRSRRPLRASRHARRGRLRARLPGHRPAPRARRRGQGDQALVGRGQRLGRALPA